MFSIFETSSEQMLCRWSSRRKHICLSLPQPVSTFLMQISWAEKKPTIVCQGSLVIRTASVHHPHFIRHSSASVPALGSSDDRLRVFRPQFSSNRRLNRQTIFRWVLLKLVLFFKKETSFTSKFLSDCILSKIIKIHCLRPAKKILYSLSVSF